jgi:hypothetical protein
MRSLGLALLALLLALPAWAADEAAKAAQQGVTGISAFKLSFPTARLPDFAPEVMDAAIVSRAGSRDHASYFLQAGTKGNVCSAPRNGPGEMDCEEWGVVAIKTDSGFSDVITEDNDNAVLFVRAMLDGKRQTLLLTARRSAPSGPPAPAFHIQPAAVTFTAYALHVDWGIDSEDLSFQPVRSWAGAGSYCRAEAAMWVLTGENRKERC